MLFLPLFSWHLSVKDLFWAKWWDFRPIQTAGPPKLLKKLLNESSKVPQKWHHFLWKKMDVSENRGVPPQIIHFNRGFPLINHPFWGKHPYFWKHPNITLAAFCWTSIWISFSLFLSQCEACSEQAWEGGGKWMGFQHRECRLWVGEFSMAKSLQK